MVQILFSNINLVAYFMESIFIHQKNDTLLTRVLFVTLKNDSSILWLGFQIQLMTHEYGQQLRFINILLDSSHQANTY